MVRQEAAPREVCFSRRRCTDEAIRIASRYFATVRRAMSIPASCSFSTMVSSDSTWPGLSASISCLIRWRTASAEWASPPSADAMAEVKKYFSSKMPQMLDAVDEKRVLLAYDLGRYFQNGFGALVECAQQPGRVLQAIGEIGLLLLVLRGLRKFGMVGLVDQHLGQCVGIEFDGEAAVRPGAHEHIRYDRLHVG